MVRPSYVLGGRAMQIIREEAQLGDYLLGTLPELVPTEVKARYPNDKTGQINTLLGKNPLLFDRYLSDAIEVDVDALADGKDVFVCGIMEHIEEAGIHSGDSACSLPPHSLGAEMIAELERQTRALALALEVKGLMNVQYAIKDGDIYVLEVNPRASRTVPFVAKTIGVPFAKIGALVMAGEPLAEFGLKPNGIDHVAVKEAVFPFARFPDVDTLLGPEMRSTGEAMGLDRDFAIAFAKSQLGAGGLVPTAGTVFVSVRDSDKPLILDADPAAGAARLPDHRDRRHPALPRRRGRRLRQDQQGARRPAAHRRRDQERRDPARLQHHRGRPRAVRQPLAAPRRPAPQGALLHHGRRRGRGLARASRPTATASSRCGRSSPISAAPPDPRPRSAGLARPTKVLEAGPDLSDARATAGFAPGARCQPRRSESRARQPASGATPFAGAGLEVRPRQHYLAAACPGRIVVRGAEFRANRSSGPDVIIGSRDSAEQIQVRVEP